MPLIALILLPFVGSLVAALLPSNARNAESTLAGVIAAFAPARRASHLDPVEAIRTV